jgi:hypothetical protein
MVDQLSVVGSAPKVKDGFSMTLLEELQAQILAESDGLGNRTTPITSPIAPGDLRLTKKSSGSPPDTAGANTPPPQERAPSEQ